MIIIMNKYLIPKQSNYTSILGNIKVAAFGSPKAKGVCNCPHSCGSGACPSCGNNPCSKCKSSISSTNIWD